ncbi:hypothetical protein FDECE_2699 [Fusarium decemcellulare]|nr:hypothetical protein FDECE_2699 [Fusarium decemcellulare]
MDSEHSHFVIIGFPSSPLWEWMKQSKPDICDLKRVKWNFEKVLIGRDELVKERWAGTTKLEVFKAPTEEELKKAWPEAREKG